MKAASQCRYCLPTAAGPGRTPARRHPLIVAERAGVERKALARLEKGETERFDGDFLARLCVFYGVSSIAELLEFDPNGRLAPNLPPAIAMPG
jgi:hypothetical protein